MNYNQLHHSFMQVRSDTYHLCDALEIEDYVIQTIDDVSPPKWHIAHTSWFFETFILVPFLKGYKRFNPLYESLFNSYYQSIGDCYPRSKRGLLSRPTVSEVFDYFNSVNKHIEILLSLGEDENSTEIKKRIIIGINHEQQHQELLLMDIKHNFFCNPLRPNYHQKTTSDSNNVIQTHKLQWHHFSEGEYQIGSKGESFYYDNETPRFSTVVQNYQLASRLVTNGEFIDFIEDNGYASPQYWMADGWQLIRKQAWNAPLYWEKQGNQWLQMTLHGMQAVIRNEPVCHVSYYEADAYARWAGKRLPTEIEWEVASSDVPITGTFRESGLLQPQLAQQAGLSQMFGDVWEWTASAYQPYPGYKPIFQGLNEYNGKFMCNQIVLRGGCCVTPKAHIRATYRNYYYPNNRWQFAGIRLAS